MKAAEVLFRVGVFCALALVGAMIVLGVVTGVTNATLGCAV